MDRFVVGRRSLIAPFLPGLADQYCHPNGTVMTVRRAVLWRRDADAAAWASENGYAPLGVKLSLWAEQGCWPE
jgi:hypothetical protein